MIPERMMRQNAQPANLDTCYENIKKLPLYRYYNVDAVRARKNDSYQIGFMADDVKTVYPKSVSELPFKIGPYSTVPNINYEQLHMAHVGTTQKLIQTVEAQQSTIQGLQQTVETLLGKLGS